MEPCGVCNGTLCYMGTLGNLLWFRCRQCGKEYSFTNDQIDQDLLDIIEEED